MGTGWSAYVLVGEGSGVDGLGGNGSGSDGSGRNGLGEDGRAGTDLVGDVSVRYVSVGNGWVGKKFQQTLLVLTGFTRQPGLILPLLITCKVVSIVRPVFHWVSMDTLKYR
jgi:hypothetical protein